MRTEEEIRDIKTRIENAYNDRKNVRSQAFTTSSIDALEWTLGEYEDWGAIEALKRYDESKPKGRKKR